MGRTGEDRGLVRAARRGAADARASLYARHATAAWRTAHLITARRELAEDIVQEAFLAAFAALDRFDDRRPFRPWLLRIVTNRALNAVRDEARAVPVAAPVVVDAPDDWPLDDDALRSALLELPPSTRAALALRFWLDLSHDEIAEALGVPAGTVGSRLSRGLAELRARLEEDR